MINTEVISLKKPGQFVEIPVHNLQCTLNWTSKVDLDFIAYYMPKSGAPVKKGLLDKLFGSSPQGKGKVFYGSKGELKKFPFISLDQDAGIGDVGGDNEENLRFGNIDAHEHILIVANIFGKSNANFAKYDGKVTLRADGKQFVVPLTSTDGGNYCVIARIENVDGVAKLVNVNKTLSGEPNIKDFI